MPMPLLAQTLHGYDQGHRLLAATEALLDARELALLDRLSDLSGYLPSGTTFDRYHTGFPCGRYYALACTWLDTSAARAGTVLTHTLLLPLQEARAIEDLWALAAHHRLPKGAADRAFYTQPLEVELLPGAPPSEVPPAEKEGVVALAFGQSQRPLLWVDTQRPDGIIRYLWSLLWPEQREIFAFCSLALQLRAVEGNSFDFLSLPPEARGAFLQFAGKEVWWDNGRIVHSRVQGLGQQPWAQDILRGGPSVTHRLIEWCHAQSLSLPQAGDIPVLWRFLDLESAASERLTAARSRADLFERLWPEIDPLHPCATRVLEDLLGRQHDAALKPRPFWELVDLLKRRLLQRRCKADPEFTARVEEVRATELTERLRQEPELSTAGLPELIDASGAVSWSQRSVHAIQEAVRHKATPVSLVVHLLLASAERDWVDIAEAILAPMTGLDRNRVLDDALQAATGKLQLLSFVSRIAEKLRDPAFLLTVALHRGGEAEALKAAMRLLTVRESFPRRDEIDQLLQRVEKRARLEWALDEPDKRLAPVATALIVRELHDASLPPAQAVKLCEGRLNGPRALAAWLKELSLPSHTARLLRESPTLTQELLLLMLRDEHSPQSRSLFREVVEALEPEQIFTSEIRETLLVNRNRARDSEFAVHLGPAWIREMASTSRSPESLALWLDLPLLRDWLRDASQGQLFYVLSRGHPSRHLPRLAAVIHIWLLQNDSTDDSWIPRLLRYFLEEARPTYLEEASLDLAHILRRVSPRHEGLYLAMQILELIRDDPTRSSWRLVEIAFPIIYPQLQQNAPSWLKQAFRSVSAWVIGVKEKAWDHAGTLRWWLIDTYVSHKWPPGSLLRCLNGDEQLFRRLVYRAARTASGLKYLRSLPRALDSDPELARQWRLSVEDALADPRRPVEYE
jgi:GTPase-associated protein 1, N-terminal domain type 1